MKIGILGLLIVFILLIVMLKKKYSLNNLKNKFRKLEDKNITIITGDELILKNVDFYREIPFNKNKYYVYYLNTLIKDKYKKQMLQVNFIKACIIYFIQNDILELKKEKTIIELVIKDENIVTLKDKKDIEFIKILQSMSINNILKKESFENIDKNNSDKIVLWYVEAFENAQQLWYHKTPDERHADIAIIKGLEKFLKEYSKIDVKSAEEVKIWEEYLSFSVILEIADSTMKELEEIIPNEVFEKIMFKSKRVIFQLLKKTLNYKDKGEENEQ